ncbi:MAG TPA: hypothetical protein DCX46_05050, partial [Bacteroidetes bacterium]|nr:hypothetical protein [Bacteroidota bacterium]
IAPSTTKVGTTAAGFLKIGAGPRSLALGGAGVALDGDLYGVYWNPASISRIATSGAATFNHANWIADIDFNVAAVALHVGDAGAFALSVTSFSVPEDIVRTLRDEAGDGRRFDAGSMAVGVSYAASLTDRFSFGITGKYIREQIWNESASGFALDVGTLFITPFNDMKIGASMTNFGTTLRLEGSDLYFNRDPDPAVTGGAENIPSQYRVGEYSLPLSFRVGIAMDVVQEEGVTLTSVVDATHPNDNAEYLGMGLEGNFNRLIYGRIGYKSLFLEDSEQGLTWGLGVRYEFGVNSILMIDYGFADYGRLNNVQFVSASLYF